MRNSTWKKIAEIGIIFVVLVYSFGGVALTVLCASVFGVTLASLLSLNWTDLLRPPIVISFFCIWLPLPFALAGSLSLLRAGRYRWSLLISLVAPLFSLVLLLLGIVLILAPLGR